MKVMKQQCYSWAVATCLALLFAGCSKNNSQDLPEPEPSGHVDKTELLLDETGNMPDTLTVNIDDEWDFSVEGDWFKVDKQGNKLFVLAPMWIESEKGQANKDIKAREVETREGKIIVKKGSLEIPISVKQENIFVGKFSQGGIIYYLNDKGEHGKPFPDCKGLVWSLEESYGRWFYRYWATYNGKYTMGHYGTEILKAIEEGKLNMRENDGYQQTEQYMNYFDTIDDKAFGYSARSLDDYEDWTPDLTWTPDKDIYIPNYYWFKWKYWHKEVNGYNDWYIPSFQEMLQPLYMTGEKLIWRIKELITKKHDEEPDNENIIPIESKYKALPEKSTMAEIYKGIAYDFSKTTLGFKYLSSSLPPIRLKVGIALRLDILCNTLNYNYETYTPEEYVEIIKLSVYQNKKDDTDGYSSSWDIGQRSIIRPVRKF